MAEWNKEAILIEGNLERATEIFAEVATVRKLIAEAETLQPTLRLFYQVDPFVATDGDGVTRTHDQVEAFAMLMLPSDDVRMRVNALLIQMLGEKVNSYRLSLKKLGVKLEDDIQPAKPSKPKKGARILRLTGPKKDAAA